MRTTIKRKHRRADTFCLATTITATTCIITLFLNHLHYHVYVAIKTGALPRSQISDSRATILHKMIRLLEGEYRKLHAARYVRELMDGASVPKVPQFTWLRHNILKRSPTGQYPDEVRGNQIVWELKAKYINRKCA